MTEINCVDKKEHWIFSRNVKAIPVEFRHVLAVADIYEGK